MIPVCPKCDVALIIMEFKGIEVDFCSKCRGLWMDSGELEALLARTNAALSDPFVGFITAAATRTAERNLCPRCDRRMGEVEKNCPDGTLLRLERCTNGHGIWFDAQELPKLLASFPEDHGTGRTIEYLNEVLGGPAMPTASS
jgi:uncharacterized protein